MEGPLAIAQAFTEQTFHYTSQAELASGLEACTFELSFHRFAILHHVDLRRRPAAMIHIDNYPAVWSEHFIQRRLFLEDPILRSSLTTRSEERMLGKVCVCTCKSRGLPKD